MKKKLQLVMKYVGFFASAGAEMRTYMVVRVDSSIC